MANTRKFDEDAVLDTILTTFWRQGFLATSMDDLVANTGVKRQSLYNAFGNKDRMFALAYERYLAGLKRALFQDRPPDASLEDRLCAVLEAFMSIVVDAETPAGCLVTNSVVEFGERLDDPMNAALKDHFASIEGLLVQEFEAAQSAGEWPPDGDPKSAAHAMIGAVVALAVMYRLNRDAQYARDIVDVTVRGICAAPLTPGYRWCRGGA